MAHGNGSSLAQQQQEQEEQEEEEQEEEQEDEEGKDFMHGFTAVFGIALGTHAS
jgi:hypothetical protein